MKVRGARGCGCQKRHGLNLSAQQGGSPHQGNESCFPPSCITGHFAEQKRKHWTAGGAVVQHPQNLTFPQALTALQQPPAAPPGSKSGAAAEVGCCG